MFILFTHNIDAFGRKNMFQIMIINNETKEQLSNAKNTFNIGRAQSRVQKNFSKVLLTWCHV